MFIYNKKVDKKVKDTNQSTDNINTANKTLVKKQRKTMNTKQTTKTLLAAIIILAGTIITIGTANATNNTYTECVIKAKNQHSTHTNVDVLIVTDKGSWILQDVEETKNKVTSTKIRYNNPDTIKYDITANGQPGILWQNTSFDTSKLECVNKVTIPEPPKTTVPAPSTSIETVTTPAQPTPSTQQTTQTTTPQTVKAAAPTTYRHTTPQTVTETLPETKPVQAVKAQPKYTG